MQFDASLFLFCLFLRAVSARAQIMGVIRIACEKTGADRERFS
jgi:hypothetical protein